MSRHASSCIVVASAMPLEVSAAVVSSTSASRIVNAPLGCSNSKLRALSADLFPKVMAEAIATFLLVFTSGGAGVMSKRDQEVVSSLAVSTAGGLTVMVMVYAVGHISGAHMNPAVTFAFATTSCFPWIQVPAYMSAQFVGAVAAAFSLRVLFPGMHDYAATTPASSSHAALVVEFVSSFTMMFVASAVATDIQAVGELGGLVVGSTVSIAAIFAGPISGGSMNPARTLGPALASKKYDGLWVYFVGPVLGTLSGALSYNFVRLPCPNSGSKNNGGNGVDSNSNGSVMASEGQLSLRQRRMQRLDVASIAPNGTDNRIDNL